MRPRDVPKSRIVSRCSDLLRGAQQKDLSRTRRQRPRLATLTFIHPSLVVEYRYPRRPIVLLRRKRRPSFASISHANAHRQAYRRPLGQTRFPLAAWNHRQVRALLRADERETASRYHQGRGKNSQARAHGCPPLHCIHPGKRTVDLAAAARIGYSACLAA
jgi:hypothetical protein